ncbi:MAG: hypothetical protein C5B59_08765 [Bacteroidetes bacterium]|nr:MAG: hypothetical protein C5B59_08765 [Bacteroidota bacterium]
MDRTNDVIVGTATNYSWPQFKNYAVSLSESGFSGRKVLFVNNISSIARSTLTKLGFELIDYEKKELNTVIQRFKLFSDWLEAQSAVRYAIHCDVKDVVIQRDPSVWMEQNPDDKVWGASEFILYRDEFANPQWVEKVYGVSGRQLLANEEILCAGTVAGEADAVKRLTRKMYQKSIDRFGDDQAILNMLLRTDPEFKNVSRVPKWDEGFILTAGWWLIGDVVGNPDRPIGQRSLLRNNPPELRNGVAYPHGQSEPYCIVHQYERGNAWAPKITEHWQPTIKVEDEPYMPAPKPIRMTGPTKYAADGLTIDWFDQWARG